MLCDLGPDIKALEKFINGDLGIGDNFFQELIKGVTNEVNNANVDTSRINDFPDFGDKYKSSMNQIYGSKQIPEYSGLKAIEKASISSMFETLKPYTELIKLIFEFLAVIEDITARINELPNPAYIEGTFSYGKDSINELFSSLQLDQNNPFNAVEEEKEKFLTPRLDVKEIDPLPDFTLPNPPPFEVGENSFDRIRKDQGTVGKSNEESRIEKPVKIILTNLNELGMKVDPPENEIEEGENWFGHFEIITNPIQLKKVRETELKDRYENDPDVKEFLPTLLDNIRPIQENRELKKETQNRRFTTNLDPTFPPNVRIGWWNYKEIEYQGEKVIINPEIEYVIDYKKVRGNYLFFATNKIEQKLQEEEQNAEDLTPKLNEEFMNDFRNLDLNSRLDHQKGKLSGISEDLNTNLDNSSNAINANIDDTNRSLSELVANLNSQGLDNATIQNVGAKYLDYVNSLQNISDNTTSYISKSKALDADLNQDYNRIIDVDFRNLVTDIENNSEDEDKIKQSVQKADSNKEVILNKFSDFQSEINNVNEDFEKSFANSDIAYNEFVSSLPPETPSSNIQSLNQRHEARKDLFNETKEVTRKTLSLYIDFSNGFFGETIDKIGESFLKLSGALQQLKNFGSILNLDDCLEVEKAFDKIPRRGPRIYLGKFWAYTVPVVAITALIPKIIEIIRLISSVLSIALNPTKLFDLLFKIIQLKLGEHFKPFDLNLDWNSPEFKKMKDELFINKLNLNIPEAKIPFVMENFDDLKTYAQLPEVQFDNLRNIPQPELDAILNLESPTIDALNLNLNLYAQLQRLPDLDIPNLQYIFDLGLTLPDLIPIIRLPELSFDFVIPELQRLNITMPEFQGINLDILRRLDFLGIDFNLIIPDLIPDLNLIYSIPNFPELNLDILRDFEIDFLRKVNLDLISDINFDLLNNIDFDNPFGNLDFIMDGFAVLPFPFGFGIDFSLPQAKFELIKPFDLDFKDYVIEFSRQLTFSLDGIGKLSELALPDLNTPPIPDLPGLNIPDLPDAPNRDDFPDLPERPDIPTIPEIPRQPPLGIPSVPNIPDKPNITNKKIQPVFSFIMNLISVPIRFVIDMFKLTLEKVTSAFKIWTIPGLLKDLSTFEFVTDFLKFDKVLEFFGIKLNLDDLKNFYTDIEIPLLNIPEISDIDIPTILVQLKNRVLTLPKFFTSIFKLIEGIINAFIKMPTKVIGLPNLPDIKLLSLLDLGKLMLPVIQDINFLEKFNSLDLELNNLDINTFQSNFDIPGFDINRLRNFFDTDIPDILIDLPDIKLPNIQALLDFNIPNLPSIDFDFLFNLELPNLMFDLPINIPRDIRSAISRESIPRDVLDRIKIRDISQDIPEIRNIPEIKDIPQKINIDKFGDIPLSDIERYSFNLDRFNLLFDINFPNFSLNQLNIIANIPNLEGLKVRLGNFDLPQLTLAELRLKLEEQANFDLDISRAKLEIGKIRKKINFNKGFNLGKIDLGDLNLPELPGIQLPEIPSIDSFEFNLPNLRAMLPNVRIPDFPNIPGIDLPLDVSFDVELGLPNVQFNLPGIELPQLNLRPLELNIATTFPPTPNFPDLAGKLPC